MRKSRHILVLALALAAAPALAQQGKVQSGAAAAATSNDAELRSQIQTALQGEPALAKEQVTVEVIAGTVRLSGIVGTRKERKTALRIARTYAGHHRVINKITLRAPEWMPSGNGAPGTGDGVPTSAAPDSNNPEIPPAPQK